jgi:hypothetical protein
LTTLPIPRQKICQSLFCMALFFSVVDNIQTPDHIEVLLMQNVKDDFRVLGSLMEIDTQDA